jgi:hypothetical protein
MVGLIAVVLTVLDVTVGPRSVHAPPARPVPVAAAPSSRAALLDAEAHTMQGASVRLAREVTRAARCDPRRARFEACVLPALRFGGMGGIDAARLLVTVVAVAAGGCRTVLLELQAADAALGDQSRWLLSQLYSAPRVRARREVAAGLGLAARMMARATRQAPPCAPAAPSGPAV